MAYPPLTDITLEAKVAFLRQPTSFPEPAWRVEAIETHMSWVFLTEKCAWKLKKPVHYDALDFRTLDARRHFCEEEVRLNRRLAPDVYLGVEALRVDSGGHLRLGGTGEAIDWLVRMRRLPEDRMLDYAIRNGEAGVADMDAVAARLATFFRECAPAPLGPEQYRLRLLYSIQQHAKELLAPDFRLSHDLIDSLSRALMTVLRQSASLFDERIKEGRVVEGHGDLRPEHVCLKKPVPLIIDCLEFSRELRTQDAGDEIAFLMLECERLGADALARRLLVSYRRKSGDDLPDGLVAFYQAYRALLRATIAVRHLYEEKFRYSPHWRRRALDYLALGEQRLAN